jgi:hypothetical protein
MGSKVALEHGEKPIGGEHIGILVSPGDTLASCPRGGQPILTFCLVDRAHSNTMQNVFKNINSLEAIIQIKKSRAVRVAQWQSACLVCVKHGFHLQPKKKKKERNECSLHFAQL